MFPKLAVVKVLRWPRCAARRHPIDEETVDYTDGRVRAWFHCHCGARRRLVYQSTNCLVPAILDGMPRRVARFSNIPQAQS